MILTLSKSQNCFIKSQDLLRCVQHLTATAPYTVQRLYGLLSGSLFCETGHFLLGDGGYPWINNSISFMRPYREPVPTSAIPFQGDGA